MGNVLEAVQKCAPGDLERPTTPRNINEATGEPAPELHSWMSDAQRMKASRGSNNNIQSGLLSQGVGGGKDIALAAGIMLLVNNITGLKGFAQFVFQIGNAAHPIRDMMHALRLNQL